MSLWVDQVRGNIVSAAAWKLISTLKFRPRSLDELHYHQGLSVRLKSLVSSVSCLWGLSSLSSRPPQGTSHTCYSMVRQERERRLGLHALCGSCLVRGWRRFSLWRVHIPEMVLKNTNCSWKLINEYSCHLQNVNWRSTSYKAISI